MKNVRHIKRSYTKKYDSIEKHKENINSLEFIEVDHLEFEFNELENISYKIHLQGPFENNSFQYLVTTNEYSNSYIETYLNGGYLSTLEECKNKSFEFLICFLQDKFTYYSERSYDNFYDYFLKIKDEVEYTYKNLNNISELVEVLNN